jgi:hypothetical protein
MRFARLVLALSAVPYAAIGLLFLVLPAAGAGRVGLALGGATADADVRAVYGGLQLGVAAFLALCAARPGWVRAGLAAQVLGFGGLAGARVVSLAVVGAPAPLGLALHGGELAGLACGLAACWRLRRGVGPRPGEAA